MGFYQSVSGIGITLGPVIIGLMNDWSELKTAFFIIAAFSALSAALTWRLMKVPCGIEKKAVV
jgi:MFS family permease